MTDHSDRPRASPAIALLAAIFVAALAADLAAKALARAWLSAGEPASIIPGFDLTLSFNRGVSFGLFPASSPQGVAFMAAVQFAIVGGLLVWAWREREYWLRITVALIVAGAIGNIVDRLVFGAVTDFIDLHAGSWHWPAFNLADCWIFLGVVALAIPQFFPKAALPAENSRSVP